MPLDLYFRNLQLFCSRQIQNEPISRSNRCYSYTTSDSSTVNFRHMEYLPSTSPAAYDTWSVEAYENSRLED